MTQPQTPEPTNKFHAGTGSPVFVKHEGLWLPKTAERQSLLQKFWHRTGLKEKTLWDVLQLLIVPTALAMGTFYLQETAKQRDLQIAEANRQKEQQIADDRAKQEILNRYFDQISTLLFERKLRTARQEDEVRIVARARTLTALRDLDGDRKGSLIRFLSETKLIHGGKPIIDLEDADLGKANLFAADLREANLRGLNLQEADLSGANLTGADLKGTKLKGADLFMSHLTEINLIGADLSGVDLSGAEISGVDLSRTTIKGAVLWGVDISDSKLDDQLKDVYLCRTILSLSKEGVSNRDCDKLKQIKQKRGAAELHLPSQKLKSNLPLE